MTTQRCSTCGSEQGFYTDKASGRSRCLACFAPQEEPEGKAEAPPSPASQGARSKQQAAPKPASSTAKSKQKGKATR